MLLNNEPTPEFHDVKSTLKRIENAKQLYFSYVKQYSTYVANLINHILMLNRRRGNVEITSEIRHKINLMDVNGRYINFCLLMLDQRL